MADRRLVHLRSSNLPHRNSYPSITVLNVVHSNPRQSFGPSVDVLPLSLQLFHSDGRKVLPPETLRLPLQSLLMMFVQKHHIIELSERKRGQWLVYPSHRFLSRREHSSRQAGYCNAETCEPAEPPSSFRA